MEARGFVEGARREARPRAAFMLLFKLLSAGNKSTDSKLRLKALKSTTTGALHGRRLIQERRKCRRLSQNHLVDST